MSEYAEQVERINANVANAYAALSEMGATMPEQQNSDNLAGTARTVPQTGGGSLEGAVLYTEQTLTEDQKTQARKNIGAVAEGEGSASGGTVAWADVQDKPVEKNGTGDTLTWDGNTNGKLAIDLAGDGSFILVKISDEYISPAELDNGFSFTVTNGTNSISYTENHSTIESLGGAVLLQANGQILFVSVETDENADAIGLPGGEPGSYISLINGVWVCSVTINGYTGFPTEEVLAADYLPQIPASKLPFVVLAWANGVGSEAGIYWLIDYYTKNKLTKADLQEIVDTDLPFILKTDRYRVFFPSRVDVSSDYGAVHLMGETMKVVTAEYVPET